MRIKKIIFVGSYIIFFLYHLQTKTKKLTNKQKRTKKRYPLLQTLKQRKKGKKKEKKKKKKMIRRPASTLVQEPQQLHHERPHHHALGSLAAAKQMFPVPPAIEDPQLDGGKKSGGADLGTTIIAVSYDGGVILAADSRTSTGTYVVNRVTNKLTKLVENVYCCRSGSAADTQAFAEMVSRHMRQHAIDTDAKYVPVKSVASLFQKLCYMYKNQIQAGIIVGGWDPINGGTVFNIPLGGAMIQHHYAMGGSGSIFLYSWMDKMYRPNMTKDQCLQLVREAVSHALSRDGSSGGLVRTICIDSKGSEHTTLPWKNIPYRIEADLQFSSLTLQNEQTGPSAKTGPNQTESNGKPGSTASSSSSSASAASAAATTVKQD